MAATRVRFAPVLEWLVAAAFIAGALIDVTIAVRDARQVRALTPVMAREAAAPEPPPVVPSRSVAVPMLPLADGKELRVGDRASEVLERLGMWAQVGPDSIERDGASERITRFYEYVGTRFALVFQTPRPGVEPRVVAIYRN